MANRSDLEKRIEELEDKVTDLENKFEQLMQDFELIKVLKIEPTLLN